MRSPRRGCRIATSSFERRVPMPVPMGSRFDTAREPTQATTRLALYDTGNHWASARHVGPGAGVLDVKELARWLEELHGKLPFRVTLLDKAKPQPQ